MLKKPTVNIGSRQQGRLRYPSVIDCAEGKDAIAEALRKAVSAEFRRGLDNMAIPYADGKIARRIKDVLRDVELEGLFQKRFFDLK